MIPALWGSGPGQLSSLCQSLVLFGFLIMYIRRLPSRDGCFSFNLVYTPDYYLEVQVHCLRKVQPQQLS